MTQQQILDVAGYEESDCYTPLQRLVLRYADALSDTPARVPPQLFDALRAELDEQQLVELTSAIAWKNYLARFNAAFEVEAEGLAEADFCLLPPQL